MSPDDRDPGPDRTVSDGDPDADLDAEFDAELDAELADGGDVGASLRALLEAPQGIERRTADVVDRSLRGRSGLDLGLDLLGLGWWTARTILTDDPPPADGEGEGNDHEE